MSHAPLAASRALWNRSRFGLESDEMLAPLLDRGEVSPGFAPCKTR